MRTAPASRLVAAVLAGALIAVAPAFAESNEIRQEGESPAPDDALSLQIGPGEGYLVSFTLAQPTWCELTLALIGPGPVEALVAWYGADETHAPAVLVVSLGTTHPALRAEAWDLAIELDDPVPEWSGDYAKYTSRNEFIAGNHEVAVGLQAQGTGESKPLVVEISCQDRWDSSHIGTNFQLHRQAEFQSQTSVALEPVSGWHTFVTPREFATVQRSGEWRVGYLGSIQGAGLLDLRLRAPDETSARLLAPGPETFALLHARGEGVASIEAEYAGATSGVDLLLFVFSTA